MVTKEGLLAAGRSAAEGIRGNPGAALVAAGLGAACSLPVAGIGELLLAAGLVGAGLALKAGVVKLGKKEDGDV